MIKSVFIETAFIALSGGKLSADSRIKRVDIAAYLPVAVNAAILQDFYERRRANQQDLAAGDFFATRFDVNESFFQTLTAPIEDFGTLKKVVLPKKLLSLPFNRGVSSAYQDVDFPFVMVSSPNVVAGVPSQTPFFWQDGNDIIVKGATCDDDVTIRMAVDASEIGDEEELPIPPGKEDFAIQNVIRYFSVQLGIPENTLNDNQEDGQ